MKVLSISGSVKSNSTNARLLDALGLHFTAQQFQRFDLGKVPLFHPDRDSNPLPDAVVSLRAAIAAAELVLISTPEYIYNLPAVLKNALEWIASSGEFVGKPVIAMTYTPSLPRGEKAMQSLLWSLQALDAKILVSLPMDQSMINADDQGKLTGQEGIELLQTAFELYG